jgi:hypothetical protein
MRKNSITPPRTETTSAERAPYTGAELRPFSGRAGAMDAYKLPSMRGGKPVEPSLYMTKYEGDKR